MHGLNGEGWGCGFLGGLGGSFGMAEEWKCILLATMRHSMCLLLLLHIRTK